MLEMVCKDIRPRIAAAPALESQVGHQDLEQPDGPHVEPAAPALPAPPPLPFVPDNDDGWQALRLRYVQPPETNMAALLASGAFGEDAIGPPPAPIVPTDDPQLAVQMRYDHNPNMGAIAASVMVDDAAAILPPEKAGQRSDS